MGHYDSCRDGYCAKCGAAPGNHFGGFCQFCRPKEYQAAKDAAKAAANKSPERRMNFKGRK